MVDSWVGIEDELSDEFENGDIEGCEESIIVGPIAWALELYADGAIDGRIEGLEENDGTKETVGAVEGEDDDLKIVGPSIQLEIQE